MLYIGRKAAYGLGVMWGVITAVFLLFHVLPGDPARMMLDQREDSEQLKSLQAKYGFDRPLVEQYALYLNDLSPLSLHGRQATHFASLSKGTYQVWGQLRLSANWDLALKTPFLRYSFVNPGQTVNSIMAQTVPNTLILAVASILIAMALGILLGVIAALQVNRFWDRLITVVGTLGMSVPSFFSAILLAWLLGYVLSSYTGLEMTGTLYELDDYGEALRIEWKNLILPALTLGIRPLGVVIQLTRNSILEESSQDYVRTAYAKGLSRAQVMRRHVLRNALNPVLTAVSGWFASMLSGAVFVEYIFGWNGLGKRIVDALQQLDLPVLMGAVLVIGFTFVLINLLMDLLYAWLDPRVRLN